jgi:DinB superfamily/Pentapeptide repeats (8 copies)
MVEFQDQKMIGSRFRTVDLSGSLFDDLDLSGSAFRIADLTGVRMREVYLKDVKISGAVLAGVDISGDIGGLRINDVDVGPLVEAELDRRYPERPLMRPDDPDGYRLAWDVLERLWAGTVEKARTLDPALLHEQVDGEWSFIETLRHLVFATDCWVRRAMLGDPAPWDPLGLPWDEAPDTEGVPRDRSARPSLDEVLALRRDRMGTVREVLATLTAERLAGDTVPVDAPGWPEPVSHAVKRCLRAVLNEEWEHRLFAERDLAVLAAR